MACSTRTLASPTRWSTRSSRCRTRWATKWGYGDQYGQFYVTRQHQVILHEPLFQDQDYSAGITRRRRRAQLHSLGRQHHPGKAYTIVQTLERQLFLVKR